MPCTKAIIPVAGYGTRRLPITKAIEKCMLPIGNRPMIDYVVENCVRGGITDIFFVVSPDFGQLKKYYSTNVELEEYLAARGKTDLLSGLKTIPHKANFHYIVQDPGGAYGTAVPVWIARDAIGADEHFAVLMGDYFTFRPGQAVSELTLMQQAITNHHTAGAILTVTVGDEGLKTCGILALKQGPDGQELLDKIVEKPGLDNPPSHLANVSNYIFDTAIFPQLEAVMQHPNTDGEHYITDAVGLYVQAGHDMAVVRSEGVPLDGGNLAGWVEANNVVYKHFKAS